MKKILVATDGSKYSEKALIEAKKLATIAGAEVTIITVGLSHESESSPNPQVKKELRDAEALKHKKILEEAVEVFSGFSGLLCTVYEVGDTVGEIIKLAESDKFDLLVMGSKGRGAFARTLLGSVSNKVIQHVKISVMLVK